MGVYEGNPRNELIYISPENQNRSQWNSSMEQGTANLVDKFSGLGVNEASKDTSLIQVMKAVEAAESTIKNQADENNRLRAELQKRTLELERYKLDDSTARSPHSAGLRGEHVHAVGPQYAENNNVNSALKLFPGGQTAGDDARVSQFSSPSSHSPSRYQREGDSKINLSGHGLMPISEVDNLGNFWKQDLVLKVREHEDEKLQLQKHLYEYSIKEAQIRNEKYVLEKRIAYMRMAFDQQQQDLVDAASKSLSYRQDIIEENVRLTYALQAAQQERSTFVSSLLPLLAEYSLQPPVLDAQSIVSNLKVLFKHLQEKLLVTEEKLKESQYQITPWRSDLLNYPNTRPQSPPPIGAALTSTNKMGLELVPQPAYSHGQQPISIPSNTQTSTEVDPLGRQNHHAGLIGLAAKNMELDNSERRPATEDVRYQFSAPGDSHGKHFSGETSAKQLPSTDPVRGSETGDPDAAGHQQWKDPSILWGNATSPFLTPTHDDQNSSFSPYLPPVLEEPSSSFSEAGEDDPLPAIDALQISGEAFPGRELQACGYSINGTTSCNFKWVRHFENGSVKYIEGANQPNYLVTADDVDSYLAIEVQPLDNRKRKGELVNVFANDQRKITLDPEMHEQIERTLHSGQASYEVLLEAGYLDIWEAAVLAIKKEGYSIKCIGPRGVVVTEKFRPTTMVEVTYGQPTEFSIHGTGEHRLRTSESTLRDTIVLTMKFFIIRMRESPAKAAAFAMLDTALVQWE